MCILVHRKKSDTQVQRNFRTKYAREPPSRPTIREWHKKFMETGSVLQQKGSGRPSTSAGDIERVREAFVRSPGKSIRTAARQLELPRSTVHKVLHKNLRLCAYKVQLLQALQPSDGPRPKAFATDMLARMDVEEDFLGRILFTDEAMFHVSGLLNRHNVRIWGSENPHASRALVRDSPKFYVWCGLMSTRIIGPFFFAEKTITANVYLDMLTEFAVPQLDGIQHHVILQQDGAPPHWGMAVRAYLNEQFPDRWIGRDGPIPWPSRSPDITPLDFFLWGYVKDRVYHTNVPNIDELKRRIVQAVASIDAGLLERTWKEIEYRLDVLRATNGAHIEIY
ncbi:uncharacterized protein LOC134541176 [Bacillus rossius redtenbacheri]|uniref:uncharacterized protein LOC134541176 n=1 Tax=Bacillus rossius redtenbacheri TaxID=93214 RepID=UPI002FDE9EEE